MRTQLNWIMVVSLAISVPVAAESAYTATKDGEHIISCTCVLAFAGCELKLVDALTGKQRHTWSQPGQLIAGKQYNLDQMCYRKRDVDKLGDSLCCTSLDEDNSIKRLFRGKAALR